MWVYANAVNEALPPHRAVALAKGLREAEAFQRELLAFQRRITETGHSAFEGVGSHDDLVIAAALVCWWAERRIGGRHAA